MVFTKLIVAAILINTINANDTYKLKCIKDAIYFSENDTSTDYYAITTPWEITFESRVSAELKRNNFTVFEGNPTTKCGWKFKVDMDDGNIYFKNNENQKLTDVSMDTLSNLAPGVEFAMMFGIPAVVILLCCMSCCVSDYMEERKKKKENNRSALTPVISQYQNHRTPVSNNTLTRTDLSVQDWIKNKNNDENVIDVDTSTISSVE